MIRVSARDGGAPLRCVLCHAEDGELETCAGCGARIHLECRKEVPACPTLGCSARRGEARSIYERAQTDPAGALADLADFARRRGIRPEEVLTRRDLAELEEVSGQDNRAFLDLVQMVNERLSPFQRAETLRRLEERRAAIEGARTWWDEAAAGDRGFLLSVVATIRGHRRPLTGPHDDGHQPGDDWVLTLLMLGGLSLIGGIVSALHAIFD